MFPDSKAELRLLVHHSATCVCEICSVIEYIFSPKNMLRVSVSWRRISSHPPSALFSKANWVSLRPLSYLYIDAFLYSWTEDCCRCMEIQNTNISVEGHKQQIDVVVCDNWVTDDITLFKCRSRFFKENLLKLMFRVKLTHHEVNEDEYCPSTQDYN